jgi:hypothetical protein
MKRLITCITVLGLFLIGLYIVGERIVWANEFTFCSSGEDPEEPEPESEFFDGKFIYLSVDANMPEPEIGSVDGKFIYLSIDANIPEPEIGFDGLSKYFN